MPRKYKYIIVALIISALGLISANTWLSRSTVSDSEQMASQVDLPIGDDHDDSEESSGTAEAIVGIQSYHIQLHSLTTIYNDFPLLHTYLRRQYLDVLTPPPWIKS